MYFLIKESGSYYTEKNIPINDFFFEKINKIIKEAWDFQKNSCDLIILNEHNLNELWLSNQEYYWIDIYGDNEQTLSDFVSDFFSEYCMDYGETIISERDYSFRTVKIQEN